MEKKNLTELNLTELLKKEKELKSILNFMGAVLIISPIIAILLFIQKQYGFIRFLFVMGIFVPIFLIYYSKKQLNEIKKELEKRSK